MADDLFIQEGIVIPAHEVHMSASRSGGPGGQYVNKTSSRVTVRWNVLKSAVLTDEQKARIVRFFGSHITHEGEIIVHDSESRSQHQNRESALDHLAQKIRQALYVPKKRIKTTASIAVKRERVQQKKQRGEVKQMRRKKTGNHDE